MKAMKESFNTIRKQAENDLRSLLLDGYRQVFHAHTFGQEVYRLKHVRNGATVTITLGEQEYTLKRNNKVRKVCIGALS